MTGKFDCGSVASRYKHLCSLLSTSDSSSDESDSSSDHHAEREVAIVTPCRRSIKFSHLLSRSKRRCVRPLFPPQEQRDSISVGNDDDKEAGPASRGCSFPPTVDLVWSYKSLLSTRQFSIARGCPHSGKLSDQAVQVLSRRVWLQVARKQVLASQKAYSSHRQNKLRQMKLVASQAALIYTRRIQQAADRRLHRVRSVMAKLTAEVNEHFSQPDNTGC